MRWKPALATACAPSVALVSNAPPLLAQAVQTSTLSGTIKDGSGAVLPGATVNVSSPSQVGGVQTSITDSQGVYRFPALHPGVYALEAALSGFRTVKRGDITLTLGTTTTIDLSLSVASVSETVQVVGETPIVDIKSSASNTQLSDAVLQNLPTGRFQPDIINLTPGVTSNVAYGGAQSSNALLMDGVDVSDPEGGTPWSFFNYNWVEQIQVVALGANAEYGGFTGVAANSIIRSGSNQVHGLGEYLTERKNWVANNTTSLSDALQKTFTPREIKSYWDVTGQIGFPIVKDKLFMFSGVQYFNREDRPAGYTGDFTTEKDPRTINKLTWAVSPSVRAEGFVEYDRYNLHGRGANATHPTADVTAIELSPEWNWNAQVTWTIDSKTMLNVRNGGYTGYFPIEPTPPASRSGPFPHVGGLTGLHTANIVSFGEFDRNRNVTAATLTRYADKFAGKSHEFKFGFEFERSKIRNESGYPGGRYYYDYGGPYQVYLWDGYVTNATAKRTSLYAQDTWTLTDRLTANLGLRLDVNRGSVPTGDRPEQPCPGSPRRRGVRRHRRPPDGGARQLGPVLRRAFRWAVRVHGPEPAESAHHGDGPRPQPVSGTEPDDTVDQRRDRSEHQAVVHGSIPRRNRAAAVPGFLGDGAVHQPTVPRLHGLHRHRFGLRGRSRRWTPGPTAERAPPTMDNR